MLTIGKSFSYNFVGDVTKVRVYPVAIDANIENKIYSDGYKYSNNVDLSIQSNLEYQYLIKNQNEYLTFKNNSYYQTANLGNEYLGNNPKSICIWIKTKNTSSSLSGFLGIGQDGTKTGMLCGIKSGYLYFDTGMYNLYYSNTTYLSDGNWHFICVTFDGSVLTIYVDDIKVYTQSRYNKYTSSGL